MRQCLVAHADAVLMQSPLLLLFAAEIAETEASDILLDSQLPVLPPNQFRMAGEMYLYSA